MFKVYNRYGQEMTPQWLNDTFGNVQVEAPATPDPNGYYECVELREVGDLGGDGAVAEQSGATAELPMDAFPSAAATLIIRVCDENGAPLPGVGTVFFWPDAPNLPNCGWHNRGVPGLTGQAGTSGFAMGGGAFYNPTQAQGPHQVWLWGEGKSDIVRGLGMLAGTNHTHLDVTFRRSSSETPPPPPPPPGDGEIAEQIERLADTADAALMHWQSLS